ncbi:hypothetical protein KUH03_17380 [Sphingobacterium sp. E70]|uniref:hypothetical protein n=1 Tax=Sphingobacterium sp. E70 TaxID=2853439 RepID=UPI00211CB782|nr:hypothetical protein [Sphingobacterium sp. E70]ULT28203.1 hypothetical protein KUH03_17380 [Sphingobacterium sp. E70]
MPARKQFMLTWLKNIVLCMTIVFALAYVFLIVPTAFQDWRDQLVALLLSTMVYGLSRYVLLPNIFKWSRCNAYLLGVWMTLVMAFLWRFRLFSVCLPERWSLLREMGDLQLLAGYILDSATHVGRFLYV